MELRLRTRLQCDIEQERPADDVERAEQGTGELRVSDAATYVLED